jgi:large subunit ribosomal protein L18
MFRKLKRRKEKRTDYYQRLALLKSGLPRLVVRKSNRYILGQIVEYEEYGDKVIFTVLSKKLRNFGWQYNCANTPAAYLTGLIIGFEAKKHGIDKAILDIGLHISTKGNKVYALAKGCIDAGLEIPVGEKVIPSEERIRGDHIVSYAMKLKEENEEEYKKRFSMYLSNNVLPEKISENFEEVKNKIIESYKKKD